MRILRTRLSCKSHNNVLKPDPEIFDFAEGLMQEFPGFSRIGTYCGIPMHIFNSLELTTGQ